MAGYATQTRDGSSSSPPGPIIRDPGALTSTESFTEKDFKNRHTVDFGIGDWHGATDYFRSSRERHHRHHHHHQHSEIQSSSGHFNTKPRRHSIFQMDPALPVTPPGERVQLILGNDASKQGLSPRPLFSEMEVLLTGNDDSSWKEIARWVKFEEDVEESGNRFTKPFVGTLSLHALFELRSFLQSGAMIFDMEGSTLDQISSEIVDAMVCSRDLPLAARDQIKAMILKRHKHAFEGSKKEGSSLKKKARSTSGPLLQESPLEQDNLNDPYLLGKRNIHFMKKIPPGAEASNILVGEVDFLEKPASVFVLLSEAHELGDLTEVPVPTRFIFLLLGTVRSLARNQEVGRAMGTLMSDEVFHEIAYKAGKREHITAGIDEFLDSVTVLPPGEWDPTIRIEPPKNLPSQEGRRFGPGINTVATKVDEEEEERKLLEEAGLLRTGRLFGGLINDIKRKRQFYLSEFKDSFSLQCIASWLFLYFGALTPIVTLGGLLGDATKQRLSILESLVSAMVCGIGFGTFSGQPLTVLACTGPVVVLEAIVFEYCDTAKWDYLSFRLWTGIWIAIILFLLVAFDASAFVCYITRFTEENFALLIAFIFIFESFSKLMKIQDSYPIHPPPDGMNCFCHPPSNNTVKALHNWLAVSISNCTKFGGVKSGGCSYELNVFFMSVVLFILTVSLTFKLKAFKEAPFFPSMLRRFISDFSVIISITCMTVLDFFMKVKTPKLIVPATFTPTWSGRGWVIPILNGNPWSTTIVAIIPALLATILIFMDQQITAVIVNRRENKLKKGCGYHLDLFVIAVLILECSFLGLPFFVAATVLSVNHVGSLKKESATAAPGEKPKFLGVIEQRVTQILIFTTIGVSVFLAPLLRLIPMPVLYGIFLYMGVGSLKGLQFVDRLMIMLMPSKYQPDLPYLRKVPIKRVHIFTLVQLFCLVLLWVIKSIKQTKMLFPVMLVVMIGIRKALDRYFTRRELKALDDILPEFKRKERDEVEEDDNHDEIGVDDSDGNRGHAGHKAGESGSTNVKDGVKRADGSFSNGKVKLKIPMKLGNSMRLTPMEIDTSESVKQCGFWETPNSSHQPLLAGKHGRLRKRAKKSKLDKIHPKKARKDHKQSIIKQEMDRPGWMKEQLGKDDNGEFIMIKIDSVTSLLDNVESDSAESHCKIFAEHSV